MENYLGTTDLQRLVLATNATERMTILTNGNVGINNTTPGALLTLGNGNVGNGNQLGQNYFFEALGNTPNNVDHLGFFNNDQNTSRSELTVSNSGTTGNWDDNFVAIMVHGNSLSGTLNNEYLNQPNNGLALINAQSNASANFPLTKFSIGVRNALPLSFYTNNTERMFIDPIGNIGINTVAPSTFLNVDCTGNTGAANNHTGVRFQGLPAVIGDILVVDANGNVGVRARVGGKNSTLSQEAQDEIEELKAEVNDLKKQVNALLEFNNYSKNIKLENANTNSLEIIPTPFENKTKAFYNIENFSGEAILQVLDISGKVLQVIPIKQSSGQIQIEHLQTASSTVIFNIISGGKLLISKKSIKIN